MSNDILSKLKEPLERLRLYYDPKWWQGEEGDPVQQKCNENPLWQELQNEIKAAAQTSYLGCDLCDIPDDKMEAFRDGYISALYEVGRMIYSLEKAKFDKVI